MIHQHFFFTDLQTWTNAKPTNTTVWETRYVKITSEDTIVRVRQWSVKFAVLIFHHFVFFYLLFLSVAANKKVSPSSNPCGNGYTRKNGNCDGKYAKYGPALTYMNLPAVNNGHLLSYIYETSICKLRSSFDLHESSICKLWTAFNLSESSICILRTSSD